MVQNLPSLRNLTLLVWNLWCVKAHSIRAGKAYKDSDYTVCLLLCTDSDVFRNSHNKFGKIPLYCRWQLLHKPHTVEFLDAYMVQLFNALSTCDLLCRHPSPCRGPCTDLPRIPKSRIVSVARYRRWWAQTTW